MGLGNTAKKLQTVADTAEKLYTRINELRDQIQTLRQKVDETSQQVDRIEHDLRNQRALLVALAEGEGIDAEAVLAESAIEEAEPDTTPATGGSTEVDDATETTGADPADETASDTETTGAATNDDGTTVTSEPDG